MALAAATALRHGQLEPVAHALFDVLNKHEHIPAVVADIAAFASLRNHDSRLVCARPRAVTVQPGRLSQALQSERKVLIQGITSGTSYH